MAKVPFGPALALQIVSEPSIRRLMDGARGMPVPSLADLAQSFSAYSQAVAAFGEYISGIDVNPVIASPSGIIAVDALIVAGRSG